MEKKSNKRKLNVVNKNNNNKIVFYVEVVIFDEHVTESRSQVVNKLQSYNPREISFFGGIWSTCRPKNYTVVFEFYRKQMNTLGRLHQFLKKKKKY